MSTPPGKQYEYYTSLRVHKGEPVWFSSYFSREPLVLVPTFFLFDKTFGLSLIQGFLKIGKTSCSIVNPVLHTSRLPIPRFLK